MAAFICTLFFAFDPILAYADHSAIPDSGTATVTSYWKEQLGWINANTRHSSECCNQEEHTRAGTAWSVSVGGSTYEAGCYESWSGNIYHGWYAGPTTGSASYSYIKTEDSWAYYKLNTSSFGPNEYCQGSWPSGWWGVQNLVFRVPAVGYIEMNKQIAVGAEWTKSNNSYSLSNAIYGIYSNAACTDLVATMTANASGYAKSSELTVGTYYVKEISAPAGYAISAQVIPVSVQGGSTTSVTPADAPVPTRESNGFAFNIEKFDYNRYIDKAGNAAQGAASLVGARYRVTYYDGYYSTPAECRLHSPWSGWKSTVITTRLINGRAIATYTAAGVIASDSTNVFTDDGTGKPTLPLGTYLIEEVSAPIGYHLDTKAIAPNGFVIQARRDTQDGPIVTHAMNVGLGAQTTTGGDIMSETNALISSDMVKRADVSINKYIEVTTDVDKYPDGKKPAFGVSFQIINNTGGEVKNVETGEYVKNGDVIYTLVTNDDGWCSTTQITNRANQTGQSSGALPYGDYIIREVEGTQPDGYDVIDDYAFSISYNKKGDCSLGCCQADNIANSNTGGDRNFVFNDGTGTVVCIAKIDADTGKQVRGETKFQLLDSNHNVMSFDLPYPQSGNITTFTTDINGTAVLPDKFMPGTYYVREVGAPSGYLWNSQEVPFICTTETVKEHGKYSDPMRVEFSDKPAMGAIELVKTDARTGGAITADSATYEIFAANDIVTEDGTVRAVRDQYVGEITTSLETGRGTSPNLYFGTYYLVEKSAPTGYLKDEQQHFVTLSYANDRTEIVTCEVVCSDEPVYGKLGVEKRDSQSGQLIPQEGAEFDVVAAENITGGDGYIWHYAGETIETIRIGADGKGTSQQAYELGKYKIVETKAPYGYALDSTPVEVELKYADSQTPIVQAWATKVNDAQTFVLSMEKLDRETGKVVPIRGTEIVIRAAEDIRTADGTLVHEKDKIVDSVVIDETGSGKTTCNDIVCGKYYAQEVHAPKGYMLDSERVYDIDLTWREDGRKIVQVSSTISDVPAKGEIVFTKVDAESGLPVAVAGCEAEVYANEDIVTGDGTIRAHKGEKVANLVTDANGAAVTSELYLGSYQIVETFAPEGYLLNANPVNVVLQYVNEVTSVVSAATQIADENAKGVIEITKRDRETGKVIPLAGAVFEVRAKNDIVTGDGTIRVPAGEIVATISTQDDGTCVTDPLYLGLYTVTEIKAPAGYTLDTNKYEALVSYKDQLTPITTTSESIENTAQKGVISVTKIDSETGNTVLSGGAEFSVTAVGDIVTGDGTVRARDGEVVDTIITADDGIAKTKALYLGTYSIQEITAPEGYLLTDEKQTVTLEYGDQAEPLVYEMISVADRPVKGQVYVKKENSDLEEPLADVEYEIRAKDDVVGKDGTEWYEANEVVETIITDENGVAVSQLLPLGEYVLVESVQPNGYELDTKEYAVHLQYEGQFVEIVHVDHFLYNTPSSLMVKKVSAADESLALVDAHFIGWNKQDEYDGEAAYAVFANDDIDIESVRIDYYGNFSTSDSAQDQVKKTVELSLVNVSDDNMLDYQVWTSDEKACDQGAYNLHIVSNSNGEENATDISFSVNENDTNAIFALGDIILQGEGANCFRTSTDPDIEEVTQKSSADTVALEADSAVNEGDAVLEESEEDEPSEQDTTQQNDVVVPTDNINDDFPVNRVPVVLARGFFAYSVTGEDGLAQFKYIPQGEVGFAEFQAPEGYASDRTPQYALFGSNGSIESDVEQLEDNDVVGLRFADDEIKLSISKRDVTTSEELPGNVLSVYKALSEGTVDTNGDIASEDYGDLIETWTSSNEPHMMQLLPQGSYILKEEQAVDGFTIAEDVKFQLNDTGVVQQVVMYNEHEAAVADELVETLGKTGTVWTFVLLTTSIVITGAGVYLFRKGRRV